MTRILDLNTNLAELASKLFAFPSQSECFGVNEMVICGALGVMALGAKFLISSFTKTVKQLPPSVADQDPDLVSRAITNAPFNTSTEMRQTIKDALESDIAPAQALEQEATSVMAI
jgi:hypothetical protein